MGGRGSNAFLVRTQTIPPPGETACPVVIVNDYDVYYFKDLVCYSLMENERSAILQLLEECAIRRPCDRQPCCEDHQRAASMLLLIGCKAHKAKRMRRILTNFLNRMNDLPRNLCEAAFCG
jgi:hypothetical protein